MAVSAFQDLELADEDREWDGDAAETRVPAPTQKTGPMRSKPGRARLVRRGQQGQLHGLQAAHRRRHRRQAAGGTARVMAAGNVMQGARGGVNIPERDVSRVKSHLAKYYKKMDRTPPWED